MILLPIIRLLLEEHARRPISGDVVLIGRQTVPLDPAGAMSFVAGCGAALRHVPIEVDNVTVARDGKSIADVSLFNLFCKTDSISALDANDYEGAELIHDLNYRLPGDLFRIADFIFCGSCLDNIFNPAEAMRSFARMLKVGGRLFLYEHGTMSQGAYIVFSNEWFEDYLKFNDFGDIDVRAYSYDSILDAFWLEGRQPGKDCVVVARATRTAETSNSMMPTQGQYRELHGA